MEGRTTGTDRRGEETEVSTAADGDIAGTEVDRGQRRRRTSLIVKLIRIYPALLSVAGVAANRGR